MCGRYTLSTPGEGLAELLDVEVPTELGPRFNIAPTEPAPILRLRADGTRALDIARWGLVPPWARDPSIGSRLINARCETVADKPSFADSFRDRRCLVPADGFYEWERTRRGRQPFHIRRVDRRPFVFAGIWSLWRGATPHPLESFSILTTRPNRVVAPLHDRMPVILPADRFDDWLGGSTQAALDLLLGPPNGEGLEAVPVSTWVNRAGNEGPRCLEPIGPGPLFEA